MLEAGDRIGGRARTSRPAGLHGAAIDEGATWLHQVDRNPLVEHGTRRRRDRCIRDTRAAAASWSATASPSASEESRLRRGRRRNGAHGPRRWPTTRRCRTSRFPPPATRGARPTRGSATSRPGKAPSSPPRTRTCCRCGTGAATGWTTATFGRNAASAPCSKPGSGRWRARCAAGSRCGRSTGACRAGCRCRRMRGRCRVAPASSRSRPGCCGPGGSRSPRPFPRRSRWRWTDCRWGC